MLAELGQASAPPAARKPAASGQLRLLQFRSLSFNLEREQTEAATKLIQSAAANLERRPLFMALRSSARSV